MAVRCSIFNYIRNKDRFLPDRNNDQYYLSAIFNDRLNHQYVCLSDHNCNESDFLEPFECQRRQEIQQRAFYQMQSYMSQEFQNGRYLLQPLWNSFGERTQHATKYYKPDTAEWPVRMVSQRRCARKFNYRKTPIADMLLDMPNLSTDWLTKILDWSSTGYLTAAIESSIHLWSSRTQSVQCTINVKQMDADETAQPPDDSVKMMVTSLKWDSRGEKLAYSYMVDRSAQSRNASVSTPNAIDQDTSASTVADTSDRHHYAWDTSNAADVTVYTGSSSSDDDPAQPNNANYNSYVKVWLLNVQEDDSNNNEQKTSTCGCVNDCVKCCVVAMDWLANGRVLVVGCTRSRVTFYKYDCHQRRLIVLRVMNAGEPDDMLWSSLISCLHLSRDVNSRHLAVAVVSVRRCVLKVWRIDNSLEDCGHRYDTDLTTDQKDQDLSINVTIKFTDCYTNNTNFQNKTTWVIKAFAWHPWKYSLMCYAVTSVNEDISPVVNPSWYVLANACTGQVVKRVNQATAYISCPSVRMLSVDTHSMTFNRVTGELLVSATRKYLVQKNSGASIEEKHSIVVMHALNRIFEMVSSSCTKKGMFFAWSPDGLRLAMTNSDESLRIWNFWPTVVVQEKTNCSSRDPNTRISSPENTVHLTDVDGLNNTRFGGRKHNNYYFKRNHTAMSELSLDASRVIK